MSANSVHEGTVDALRRYILTQGMRPGDMLPPLADLAGRFGVSVASLREAVRALEASGVVSLRHGVGTFLQAYDYGTILQNLAFSALFEPEMPRHLAQLRKSLELGALELVVDRLTIDDLEGLAELVDGLATDEQTLWAEYRFHMLLFRRLDNPLLEGVLRLCWPALQQLSTYEPPPDASRRLHHAVHADLLDALRVRDRAGARASLARYFDLLEQMRA